MSAQSGEVQLPSDASPGRSGGAASQMLWLGLLLTRRELAQRYRGTALGIIWPFLYSALLLLMFTAVFSVFLKVRWPSGTQSLPGDAALTIFTGMVPYLFLAEVLGRSITCITAVPNFVKKVRFPIVLLPIVVVSSALMLALVNALILVGAVLALRHTVPATVLLVPLLAFPLVLLALAIAVLLSALGVFFRDLAQASPLIAQALLFLAPVCYPLSAVPEAFSKAIAANPLTWFVTALRGLVLEGRAFAVDEWFLQTALYALLALLALAFFQRVRRSFADLL